MTNKVAHRIQHGRISTNISMAQIRLPIHSYRFCSGQSYVEKGLITIEHVPSKYQLADIFTIPLPRDQYMRLHNQIMGWTTCSPRGSVKLFQDCYLNNVSQVPFPSSQYCLEQYCTSYSTSNCFLLLLVYFI